MLWHIAACAWLALAGSMQTAIAQPLEVGLSRVLDNFEDITPWSASASDQVKATLRQVDGVEGRALCLDYDFNGVAGYAFARRALPLDFPENYRFDLKVRGDGLSNNLEVKWVDASGDNVWWARRRDYTPSAEWQAWVIKKRHIELAWGPTADKQLRRTASMELVVSSGNGGGRGSLCFDDLRFTHLPAASGAVDAPVISTVAASLDDAALVLVDLGKPREFGGIVLHWGGQSPSRYDLQFSDNAEHWKTQRSVQQAAGRVHYLLLPESETRYLRFLLRDTPAITPQLDRIEVRDVAFDYTPYELRTVGSFLRLGQGDRALQLLKFFFADQRPHGWNQWAEVVGHDARQPRFVGDMPHTWISSDYIRSALDLFAYEREDDQALVLAAGIPEAWLRGEGVSVSGLRTSYGNLGYRLRVFKGQLRLDLQPGFAIPAGGLVLKWPGTTPLSAVVNGIPAKWDGMTLRVAATRNSASVKQ